MRSSFSSFKEASNNALNKARLTVGLNQDGENNDGGDVEMSSPSNDGEIPSSRTSSFRGFLGRLGGDDESSMDNSEQSSTFVDGAAELLCPALTLQQRLIGFASCFTIAYLITFMSFKFFVKLIEGNPVPFALNYSLGNLLAISASGFLCGPQRQIRNMFDDKRKLVATAYLTCLGSTLVVTFIPLPWALKLLTLCLLLITQCGASIWYSLSYIPLGRKTALRLIKKYLGIETSRGEGFMGLSGSGELG